MFCHHNEMYYLCNVFRGSASMTTQKDSRPGFLPNCRNLTHCKYTAFLLIFQISQN